MIFFFFLNFILIYKLNIQIQISLVIGNLYSADPISGISSIKKKKKKNNNNNKKDNNNNNNNHTDGHCSHP